MYRIDNYADEVCLKELFENEGENVSGSFDRIHYSPSFINGWSNCPACVAISQFFRSDSRVLKIGSAVHKILEEHYKEGKTKEESIASVSTLDDLDGFDKTDTEMYLRSYFSIPMYKDLHNVQHFTEQEIINSPEPLSTALPSCLKGFIDRIDLSSEGLYLVDYKTSSRDYNGNNYIDQMTIYKWIVEEEWGMPVDGLYIGFINNKAPKYHELKPTLRQQSELIDKIYTVDEEVEASISERKYPKRRGMQCRWCAFKNFCELNDVKFDNDKKEFRC